MVAQWLKMQVLGVGVFSYVIFCAPFYHAVTAPLEYVLNCLVLAVFTVKRHCYNVSLCTHKNIHYLVHSIDVANLS